MKRPALVAVVITAFGVLGASLIADAQMIRVFPELVIQSDERIIEAYVGR